MAKKKLGGLGKGLDSLFADLSDDTGSEASNSTLPLREIEPAPEQPRKRFADDALNQLADSITENGLLQPIAVRPKKVGPGYIIIAGERRWRAARLAGLDEVPVIIKDVTDEQAAALRAELKQEKIFLLNLMSAPGSGKTTTLRRTIAALQNELRIGVMEADIDSDVDARAIAETGAKAIQLHTGGMCHLDAEMTRQGLAGLGTGGLDLVILENVGNLVCSAEFDTGAVKNAMILSVPEGHDKPLKYPLMFQVCDVVLVNKIDVLPYFDFDMDKCREYVALRNPNARVIPICARTGEGIDEWADWLKEQVKAWQA